MSIQVVTVTHPLAQVPRDHREDLGPSRPGCTRAVIPADPTEQSAPAAAAWLASPTEGTGVNTVRDQIDRWAQEPGYINPEGL